jgi:6-phosphogluconolactonase
VLIYELDVEQGKLRPYPDQPAVNVHAGAGPRHLAFHPHLSVVYVVNELDFSVTVFAKDGARGTLTEIQHVAGQPPGFSGRGGAADIHLHPNGRYLYSSNRAVEDHNTIASFAVDEQSGKLTPLAHTPTEGRFPRNFALTPTGSHLVVANQFTDDLHVFRLEEEGAELALTAHSAQVPNPTCIQFHSHAT